MVHIQSKKAAGLVLALSLVLCPGAAYAADAEELMVGGATMTAAQDTAGNSEEAKEDERQLQQEKLERERVQAELKKQIEEQEAEAARQEAEAQRLAELAEREKTDKVLAYDRADIRAIGTQEKTGHTICCPSFSCAYGDAVIDGTVHDHSYYTCSCCTWNDWGGGGSWNRCVGSNDELLREAYDQIRSGKPTVIHVTGGSGEHWICLIGYQNAYDPDHLTLGNFIALDPWDGAQITASSRWALYGDGCEHISTR